MCWPRPCFCTNHQWNAERYSFEINSGLILTEIDRVVKFKTGSFFSVVKFPKKKANVVMTTFA
jgi:hypothetical protein